MTTSKSKVGEVTLIEDIGTAKKGDVFVRGLHGVPNFPIYNDTTVDDWYWKKGSEKEDNKFLPANCFLTPNP